MTYEMRRFKNPASKKMFIKQWTAEITSSTIYLIKNSNKKWDALSAFTQMKETFCISIVIQMIPTFTAKLNYDKRKILLI